MSRKFVNRLPHIAAAALTIIVAVGITACGALDEKEVCSSPAQHTIVVASKSATDLRLAQQMMPAVADQAAQRAADSCGSLSVGILGGEHAEADLALHTKFFAPSKTETFGDPTPILAPLKTEASNFAQTKLIDPLKKANPVWGSPFLNGLARIAAELEVHDISHATIVVVGDGIAVERGRSGEHINFSAGEINVAAVNAFADLYAPLKDSCVVLVGSGANADLSDEQVRDARDALGNVLQKAGAEFAATRDADSIPWPCG